MRSPLEQRCACLERSLRALHDECSRLMRENEVLRQELQHTGAGDTPVHEVQYQLARIAEQPAPPEDEYAYYSSALN